MNESSPSTVAEGCLNVLNDTFQNWRNVTGMATTQENLPNVLIPPNFRIWEKVSMKKTLLDGTALKFRVLSYNVLAQCLLEQHPYLYTRCNPHNLKWEVRASRLYEEITSYAPDILCLQEVQASHIQSFYLMFEQIGYSGIFKQKTGHGEDGCAIYFKKSVFEMKEHISVEFYQPELPILNRNNIGILVKLIPIQLPHSPIVVATTHLLYNPKRTDVRLAQMRLLLAEIDHFAYCGNGNEQSHLPIILTGDFNSTPDDIVIQLLDNGHVNASHLQDGSDWKSIGVTDNCQHFSVLLNRQARRSTDFSDTHIYNSEHLSTNSAPCSQQLSISSEYHNLFNSSVLRQPLKLTSVYNKYKGDGHYEATTCQDYWITVDYIYFTHCSSLNLIERLRLPTALECEALGSLPNDVYGSDHIALAATFELSPVPPPRVPYNDASAPLFYFSNI